MTHLLPLALAVAPGLALAVYVYWRDKFEKEPLRWVAISFFLGLPAAFCAAIVSLSLSERLQNFFPPQEILQKTAEAFLGVALVEEFFKFLMIRLFLLHKPFFNEPYDGITYSVMVSLGFATIENILYVLEGGISTALLRMFTAVPAHAVFGVMMGYHLGMYRFYPNKAYHKNMALIAPILLHGFYDLSLFLHNIPFMFLGALVSLLIGVRLSLRAIKLHQERSPFQQHPHLPMG
ncbi:MAG: PrsW family glutamic-type intramembrane protease [Flavobacteriales bacterium]|nr:PrsW family glutamic-type intramembrane protease [Flavobacteriales bacterium]MCX7769152.1 PrsW family glutamic-type intramembrane protease [Flavobacteriales bacterium]MDW8410767.1 PrsW family glutamic-type intramembrane protease [Flavobacteriales bacterium]